ncbi:ABC transporter permease [Streptomyces iranensis]|uniref:ABC-type transporter, integral membrane subunit n=1 Tax=Streptomyces iranensis TaxID=576784 RepID=A0A060ZTU3_9ACTN|nr:ABC transporter permease [Streptomyces iranensis]MBP2063811.1 oligopeptide transport system permease protein [Streptomyces iranensis]CDR06801.1 ABC-type transporter, integral membrane subunit [Streptomyces iranensis]
MPDLTKTPSASEEAAAIVAGTPVTSDAGPAPEKPRSLGADAWRGLRRNPLFVVSGLLILVILLVAAFPGLFTGANPDTGDQANHFLGKPNLGHVFQEDWFGYDGTGRSLYARVLYGARNSIIVGLGVTVLVTLFGGLMGMLAGYFGGFWDSLISRLTDVFFGIPFLLGSMVVLNAFTDRTVWVVMGALAFLGWTQIARVMRGAVITTKHADYVVAAKALGAGTRRILFRHILPNAIAPVIVVATISLGTYIVAESTLSYLGLGLGDGSISWGGDISDGTQFIRNFPHVLLFPAGALSITVLAFIMMGDAVREALDPKLR